MTRRTVVEGKIDAVLQPRRPTITLGVLTDRIGGSCGATLALTNQIRGSASGVTAGIFNGINHDAKGVTAAVFANVIGGVAKGVTVSVLVNEIEDVAKGVTVSAANRIHNRASGVTVAGLFNEIGSTNDYECGSAYSIEGNANGLVLSLGLNIIKEKMMGLGLAAVNYCNDFSGVMIGLVNVAKKASRGVQIGLVNVRADAPWYARYIPVIAVRWSDKTTEEASAERADAVA